MPKGDRSEAKFEEPKVGIPVWVQVRNFGTQLAVRKISPGGYSIYHRLWPPGQGSNGQVRVSSILSWEYLRFPENFQLPALLELEPLRQFLDQGSVDA